MLNSRGRQYQDSLPFKTGPAWDGVMTRPFLLVNNNPRNKQDNEYDGNNAD